MNLKAVRPLLQPRLQAAVSEGEEIDLFSGDEDRGALLVGDAQVAVSACKVAIWLLW